MNRRVFTLTAVGAASLAATGLWHLPSVGAEAAKPADAAGARPVEGQQYQPINPPAPVAGEKGRVEVIEFFWYGCPHCNAFEPSIEPWIAKLPKDKVHFRRVHVAFNARQETHQRLWAALESMNVPDTVHQQVFKRFHVDRKPIDSADDAIAWATSAGLDPVKFRAAWFAFDMSAKLKAATALSQAYQIDGVPTLGVQGKWRTSPSDAKGPDEALRVADYLIDLARRGG